MAHQFCNNLRGGGTYPTIPSYCKCVPNVTVEASPDALFHNFIDPDTNQVILQVPVGGATVDTDTRLGNPHFGAGAPAGFSRLFYDLIDGITNTTITADFAFIDIPESQTDIVTGQLTGNTIATHTAVDGTVFDIKETITSVGTVTLSGNILTIPFTDEAGVTTNRTVDLTPLAIDINVASVVYNPLTGEITLTETDGTVHTIDIGPTVITSDTVTGQATGNTIATHTAVDGTPFDIKETITSTTDNNDGSFTQVDETGNPVTIELCKLFNDLPASTDPLCLDTVTVANPSHGILRTDLVTDDFLTVAHNDGFGTQTTAIVGLGSGIVKDASNNIATEPFNVLGQYPTSTSEVVLPLETVLFRIDPTATLDDVKSESNNLISIPQLKHNEVSGTGNIYAKYDSSIFSLANYTVLEQTSFTLTKPTVVKLTFTTDLFNPYLDMGADVAFISVLDGNFWNFQPNLVHIQRTDPTSRGTSATVEELPITIEFSTGLIGAGAHTLAVAFKVNNFVASPTTPTFVTGDPTNISSLQRDLNITYI